MKIHKIIITLLALMSCNALLKADYGMIEPRLEIRNHDINPIAITLWQLGTMKPDYILVNNQEISGKKGSKITAYTNYDIDPTVPGYIIQITYSDKGKPRRALYQLSPSRKLFLAWENNSLRPQKGTGIFSKTSQSGFSLENNITQAGIKKIQ
ncbi:MAG: hypothetical protein ACOYT8_04370 [Candidatus Dependentiae bacterium]